MVEVVIVTTSIRAVRAIGVYVVTKKIADVGILVEAGKLVWATFLGP